MSSKSHGYINFAAVKAAVSLERILDHYGLLADLKSCGQEGMRGCCPIHKGNNPKEFSVTPGKNLWNCFSVCQEGGNHLKFVTLMEDCGLNEAAWKLNEWFNLGHEPKAKAPMDSSKGRRQKSRKVPQSEPAERKHSSEQTDRPEVIEGQIEETGENKPLPFRLQNLDATHPYMTERGLSPETIQEFGVAFCSKGIMAGRVVIPIHNHAGELLAYVGRWAGDPPEGKDKYRLPGGFKKSLELFNAHRAFSQPEEQPLIVVEGFFDAIKLHQQGHRKVVALMGTHMSELQEQLIAGNLKPDSQVIVMFDDDKAGHKGRCEVAGRLALHCAVTIRPLEFES